MPFPDEIVEFTPLLNITTSDAPLIKQYQEAIQNQDTATAAALILQIPSFYRKIINGNYLNSIAETVHALEIYYLEKYSPAIIVSSPQPAGQEKTDMWFQITGEET